MNGHAVAPGAATHRERMALPPNAVFDPTVEGVEKPGAPSEAAGREPFEPIEPRRILRGMYRYMADAGIFEECRTGWRLPVAQEADNAKLEAAYSRTRREPGEALLVTLEGSIATRPRMEGPGMQRVLVPERFVDIRPGETCGTPHSAARLEDTYWKLTCLGGKAPELGAGGREVHMELVGENRRVHGYSGCNRFTGGYELEGKRLVFKRMAGTRMACGEGMEQEAAFLKALETTASWDIRGEELELFDAGGAMLLRFEAGPASSSKGPHPGQ